MSEKFDPYHKWLGIPPKDQPPSHYRLLGLEEFESDGEVIEAAANRQMAYLQEVAVGAQIAHSQQLLNEIAAARVCLLDADAKARYDTELERRHPRPRKRRVIKGKADFATVQTALPTAKPADEPEPIPAASPVKAVRSSRRYRRRTSPLPWILAGGLGLAVVIGGLVMMSQQGDAPVRRESRPAAATTAATNTYIPDRPGTGRKRDTFIIDAAAAKQIGPWQMRSPPRGGYSGKGLHVVQPGEFGQMAFFWPVGAPPGKYRLELGYVRLAKGASKVSVTIKSLNGKETKFVNQTLAPPIDERFYPLGTFHFDSLSDIVITNEGVDGPVVVDALRLIPAD